ncbi:unnamed protein product, partial [Rotaria magnacalcarata]
MIGKQFGTNLYRRLSMTPLSRLLNTDLFNLNLIRWSIYSYRPTYILQLVINLLIFARLYHANYHRHNRFRCLLH